MRYVPMNIERCRAIWWIGRPVRRCEKNVALPHQCHQKRGLFDPPCPGAGRWHNSRNAVARRGGRVVDGSGLENRQGESPRGFESHPLRQPILDFRFQIFDWGERIQRATKYAVRKPRTAAQTTSERKCAATYILEKAIRTGMRRSGVPMRQQARARVAKKAAEAAVCPEGNAW